MARRYRDARIVDEWRPRDRGSTSRHRDAIATRFSARVDAAGDDALRAVDAGARCATSGRRVRD
jgi:hypothetical protein